MYVHKKKKKDLKKNIQKHFVCELMEGIATSDWDLFHHKPKRSKMECPVSRYQRTKKKHNNRERLLFLLLFFLQAIALIYLAEYTFFSLSLFLSLLNP